MVSQCKKPKQAELEASLGPMKEAIAAAQKAKLNRKIPKDEGAVVAEALGALGWIKMVVYFLFLHYKLLVPYESIASSLEIHPGGSNRWPEVLG